MFHAELSVAEGLSVKNHSIKKIRILSKKKAKEILKKMNMVYVSK